MRRIIRRFTASFIQLPNVVDSAELVLANYLAPEEAPPAAGMDADGNSLVAWQSYLEDGSGLGIFAQKLDHEGNPLGDKHASQHDDAWQSNTAGRRDQRQRIFGHRLAKCRSGW